jgi:hypothetical protein
MRKGARECRCIAVYLPTGIDLRFFEGDEMRRTRLVPDKYLAERLSAEWDVLVLLDGEPWFSRRWPDAARARYYAEAMRQDNVRGGWRETHD